MPQVIKFFDAALRVLRRVKTALQLLEAIRRLLELLGML